MLKATVELSREIAQETDPTTVIDILQRASSTRAGVDVVGAWRTPSQREDWSAYRPNKNVFWHPNVRMSQWLEYMALAREHGPSVMMQMAWRNEGPFTFTEALRAAKPTGSDRWSFDWHQRHGRRDGLFCPCGRW